MFPRNPIAAKATAATLTVALVAATTTAATATATTAPVAAEAEPQAQAADKASRFTIATLPDTQFYSRYGTENQGNIFETRYGSNPYNVQTQFIADNHQKLNTKFVTHLGDLVDQPKDLESWHIADKAMQTLEQAEINYSVLPGNHDLAMIDGQSAFQKFFPEDRARNNTTTFQKRHQSTNVRTASDYNFPGQTIDSEYHIFEAEGQQYLVLALGFRANKQTLDWAQQVINQHPTLPVILTAHEISNIDGAGNTFYSKEYGEYLWRNLIQKNDQIFLTIAGHHHGAGYHITTNSKGNQVVNILQDYQMAYLGGNGLMGQLEFDLTNNTLEMLAYSPWVRVKETSKMTHFDHLMPTNPGDSYTIPLNFKDRFKGFAPDWSKGDENDPNYSQLLRDQLTAGFTPYEVQEAQRPTSAQDFPEVAGTVAHWRPGSISLDDAAPVPYNATLPDIAGNSPMTRARRIVAPERAVTFSTDTHPLSSDTGSLKFAEPSTKLAVAYFETAAGAPINSMTFDNGYTLEAFLKLDENFNGDKHGWSNALIREATEGQDPIQMLGISDLRELRWYAKGNNGEGFSNWSHEVPKGEWMHVAVVNDPADKSVTMFIDGAPILRDGYGPLGLSPGRAPLTGSAPASSKWILGTSAWGAVKSEGWFGSIGEIRMVDHPIGPDEWLTARAPKPEPTPTPTPTPEPTPGQPTPIRPTKPKPQPSETTVPAGPTDMTRPRPEPTEVPPSEVPTSPLPTATQTTTTTPTTITTPPTTETKSTPTSQVTTTTEPAPAPTPTETGSSGSSQSSDNQTDSSSTGSIILIVLGVLGGLLALIAALVAAFPDQVQQLRDQFGF